jgi:hypothetical protein
MLISQDLALVGDAITRDIDRAPLRGLHAGAAADLGRHEYELWMQLALLRTIEAMLPADDPEGGSTLEEVRGELRAIEDQLTRLPDSAGRPMRALAGRLGWSPEVVDFLWMAVALAADPRLLVHARALDPGAGQGLSTALYSRIVHLDAAGACALQRALHPDGALLKTGLLQAAPGTWLPSSTPWAPVPELIDHLLGEGAADLPAGVVEIGRPAEPILDDDQRTSLDAIGSALAAPGAILAIEGAEGTGRRSAIALASNRTVLALDVAGAEATPAAIERAVLGLLRAAILRDAIAVVVGLDELGSGEVRDPRRSAIARQLDRARVPIALITRRAGLELEGARPIVRVPWPVPSAAARVALWRDRAGRGDHEALAQRFRLGAGAIARAVASARAIARKSDVEPLSGAELIAGVRHDLAERMAGLAERVVVKQTWQDCVLTEDVQTQVLALIGRTEQAHVVSERWGYRARMPRGTGVAALFSGPPGTGKTMVAGLIASQLGLELYRVDASRWIGQPEAQRSRLLDAAEDGHALLLFDEADALFARRTQVRSSNDRYANLEVNYLLQRLDSFEGIAILTTNAGTSIDQAFKRRMSFRLSFPFPDEETREQLWRAHLPPELPVAGPLTLGALARKYQISGGYIRNACLRAAFLAAQDEIPLHQQHLERAIALEYAELGKLSSSGAID